MKKLLLKLFGNKEVGFTLVEAMVAISILSMAVTGPLLIAQKGIGAAIYARDQITAFYLAQEAVEYVRNVRDTNRIQNIWWLRQFCIPANAGCSSVNGTFKVDATYANFNQSVDGTPNPGAIAACSGTCPTLSFNTDEKVYGYGSGGTWSPTLFTRTITITSLSANEVKVAVTIAWNTNLFSPVRTFNVQEYMLNF